MASKAAIEVSGGAVSMWQNLTGFLTEVRAEMRKVVTPTRKEVETTTFVVLVTVFLFGAFFFVVDLAFSKGMHEILTRLGGTQ
ncbi:MAG TPA: preprotein translocase subunit SecE [Terracidiphilus sp.]|jgi:preprotein translocase subunit SecE|nr:preprotein translocase subunit SecE [Terracidiphilus sp.]